MTATLRLVGTQARLRFVGAGVAVILLVVAVVLAVTVAGRSPVEQAAAVVEDTARFETATESGVAFARAASLLKQAGEDCLDRGEVPPRCEALFTASAVTQVSAALVLRCTRPGIFDTRRGILAYLRDLGAGKDPQPPPPPSCG